MNGRTSALRDALVRDVIRLELTLVARRDACEPADEAAAG